MLASTSARVGLVVDDQGAQWCAVRPHRRWCIRLRRERLTVPACPPQSAGQHLNLLSTCSCTQERHSLHRDTTEPGRAPWDACQLRGRGGAGDCHTADPGRPVTGARRRAGAHRAGSGAGRYRCRRARGPGAVVARHAGRPRLRRLADQRRADHRAAGRLRGRRAAGADGPRAGARARRRHRPARALARDGRPLHGQPRGRAHPADHLGLRGHRAHQRREPDRDAADPIPTC